MTGRDSERGFWSSVPTDLYIGGKWRAATGGGTLPVEDPATGETLCEVADALLEDALAALAAAAGQTGRVGRDARRASAARSCAGPMRRSSRRPTSWRC